MKNVLFILITIISLNSYSSSDFLKFNEILSQLASTGSNLEGYIYNGNDDNFDYKCTKVLSGKEVFKYYQDSIKEIELNIAPSLIDESYLFKKNDALLTFKKIVLHNSFHFCFTEQQMMYSRVKGYKFINSEFSINWELGFEN